MKIEFSYVACSHKNTEQEALEAAQATIDRRAASGVEEEVVRIDVEKVRVRGAFTHGTFFSATVTSLV